MGRNTKITFSILSVLAVVVGMVVVAKAIERRPPALSLLKDVSGFETQASETFESQGSMERHSRLVILDSQQSTPFPKARDSLVSQLSEQGWTFSTPDGGLSPDRSVCVGFDSPSEYLDDHLRTREKKDFVEKASNERSVVVTLLKC